MLTNAFVRTLSLTVFLASSALFSHTLPTFSQIKDTENGRFSCKQVFDPASREKIFATVFWNPKLEKNQRIIGWKSNYFDKTISIEKRCDKVSQLFQERYTKGELNYLTFGEANGYPILCSTKNIGDVCDGTSQLFTLKPHSDPNTIRQRLDDIMSGKSSEMLLQNSGSQTQAYVSFQELLKVLPEV